jgi:hypothetical protein
MRWRWLFKLVGRWKHPSSSRLLAASPGTVRSLRPPARAPARCCVRADAGVSAEAPPARQLTSRKRRPSSRVAPAPARHSGSQVPPRRDDRESSGAGISTSGDALPLSTRSTSESDRVACPPKRKRTTSAETCHSGATGRKFESCRGLREGRAPARGSSADDREVAGLKGAPEAGVGRPLTSHEHSNAVR